MADDDVSRIGQARFDHNGQTYWVPQNWRLSREYHFRHWVDGKAIEIKPAYVAGELALQVIWGGEVAATFFSFDAAMISIHSGSLGDTIPATTSAKVPADLYSWNGLA